MSVERAVEIGNECFAVTVALDQLKTAFGNIGKPKADAYDSPLFASLIRHREALRRELRALDGTAPATAPEQRRLILTVPSAGWRVWCETPKDAYDQVADLIKDGYTFDQIKWEETE